MPDQGKKEDDNHGKNSVSDEHDVPGSNEDNERMNMETQQSQDRLGLGLKNMYQNVLDEPLPDEMMALLDQLGDLDKESEPDENPDE